jgi:putative membrane protein
VAVATNDFSQPVFLKEIHMGLEWLKPAAFLGSILFALIGVLIFWICFLIIDKLTPYKLWDEIVEKQNIALALVVAAMSLGISIIVAAAIHG